jgi:hypothetical protein
MGCCCNDIHTCHSELIHAEAEIQQAEITFTAQDWRGLNYLKIIPAGVKGNNEIGPHYLPKRSYMVTVHKSMGSDVYKEVGVTTTVDKSTGIITFWKSSIVPAFSGRVEVR